MSVVRFNEEHEWVRLDGDEAIVGITDYAQTQLGEVVHVDRPPVGKRIEQGMEVAAVESVKVSNAINAPLSGEVTAINVVLSEDPAKLNADPMGDGWLFKLRVTDAEECDALLDEAAYRKVVGAL